MLTSIVNSWGGKTANWSQITWTRPQQSFSIPGAVQTSCQPGAPKYVHGIYPTLRVSIDAVCLQSGCVTCRIATVSSVVVQGLRHLIPAQSVILTTINVPLLVSFPFISLVGLADLRMLIRLLSPCGAMGNFISTTSIIERRASRDDDPERQMHEASPNYRRYHT